MSERKAWSQQEDEALKYLYQQRQVKKWSQIAKLMVEEFNLIGRNGKQCRQRYHNHLDSRITKESWKVEQQRMLVDLHNTYGNRWAMIARQLPGRTDNCVKNHFYSKIRKAIRKLNKNISEYFRRQFKQFKIPMVYKIIEIAQQLYKQNKQSISTQTQRLCYDIKNKILEHSFDEQGQSPMTKEQILQAKEFISKAVQITKQSKNKAKKKKMKKKENEDDQQQYESGYIMDLESFQDTGLIKKSTRRSTHQIKKQQSQIYRIQVIKVEQKMKKSLHKITGMKVHLFEQSDSHQQFLQNLNKPSISIFDDNHPSNLEYSQSQHFKNMNQLKGDQESHSNIHTHDSSQLTLRSRNNLAQIFDLTKLPNLIENIIDLDNNSHSSMKEMKMVQDDFHEGFQESVFGLSSNYHKDGVFSNFFQYGANKFHI